MPKSSVRKILANTGWMLFDKVFLLVLNLLVTVRVANYYGAQGYGTYQYAVSLVALFEMLVTFVDPRVVKKRYVAEDPALLVWNATLSRLLFALLALLGGIVYLLLVGESGQFNVIFLVLLINAIVINLRFGMQNRYEYLLKSKKVVVAGNIALAIGGALQLVAVSLEWPILSIAVITASASSLCLVIVYFQYRREFGSLRRGVFSAPLVKRFVWESLPLAIAASCAIVYSRCDAIMIGNMISKSDVGIYAIAVKLVTIAQIALVPIRESVYPRMIQLYAADRTRYATQYIRITALMTWLCLCGIALSFALLPFAFRFLNPEYARAFPVYQIYIIGSFFMYNAGLRAGHYTLIGHGNILMYSQIASVLLNLALNYLLIKEIGVFGAAIATGATQGVALMASNLFFGKVGREVFTWQIRGLNPLAIFKHA